MGRIVIITGLVLSIFILFLGVLMLIHPLDNMKNGTISPSVLGILCVLYAIFRIWKSLQMLKRLKKQEEE
ncbi:MAG: hypothetical protein KatS3mg035_1319 [Bacteroidia bacterium]|nr:MAG: hypothetical protein KatS3mg035_1319 [Bacteroidia bacterium]